MMSTAAFLPAVVVMVHCICMIANLNHKEWNGHRLNFAGLAAGYSLIAGGVVGLAFGWSPSAWLLLYGLAGIVVFDRRRHV